MTLSKLLCAIPAHQRIHLFINTKDATQFIGFAQDVPERFEEMVVLVIDAHRNDLFIVLSKL